MYVQGHLLNAKLGGPGRAHNLAPITRSANKQHERDVEGTLKALVLKQNKVVRYKVNVLYGTHPSRDYQGRLKNKGHANLTEAQGRKLNLLNFEQQQMPKALKYSWHLLRYDGANKKWTQDTESKKKGSGSIPVQLPDGDFTISRK